MIYGHNFWKTNPSFVPKNNEPFYSKCSKDIKAINEEDSPCSILCSHFPSSCGSMIGGTCKDPKNWDSPSPVFKNKCLEVWNANPSLLVKNDPKKEAIDRVIAVNEEGALYYFVERKRIDKEIFLKLYTIEKYEKTKSE
jgi:hypothetical protein